jgi:sensor histidine kinase YesM
MIRQLTVLLSFFFYGAILGQPPVYTVSQEVLQQPFPVYLAHLQVYEDVTNKMPLSVVQQQLFVPFVKKFSSIPAHLPVYKTYWLKLSLQSGYSVDTNIVFYTNFQNYVQAWYADGGRLTPVARCGNMIPASALSIRQFRQALYLPLQAGKINEYYISIYNRTTYHTEALKPYVMNQASLNETQLKLLQDNRGTDFIFITGMGMFLIMIIYLLIKWIYLKDGAYFYYAISLLGGSLFYLCSFVETGNNMLFVTENPQWVYMWSDVFAFIGVFGYWQFVRKFLYVDREKPALGKYMRYVAYGILVFMMLSQLLILLNKNIWQYIQRNTITGLVILALGLHVLFSIRKLNQPLRQIVYGGIFSTVIFYFIASVYELARGTRFEFLTNLGGGSPILMLGTTIQMLFSVIGLAYRNKLESQAATDIQLKKTEAEMKALRAQMNPHFIFNCMHTIDAYIFKEQPDKASAFLNRFSKLIRHTLESSEKPFISLQSEIEALKIYTLLEQERFDFSFEVHYNISENVNSYKVPPLLLQPYAENAILHGLRHLKNIKGLLIIAASEKNNMLEIEIKDNGIGQKAAALINETNNRKHQSMAIELTRQRLQLVAQNKNEGVVNIADIENDNETGTIVTIHIPKL